MIDPVISLSRLKENVAPAHESGQAEAREKLMLAIAEEATAERTKQQPAGRSANRRGESFWSGLALPERSNRLRVAGALAVALMALTFVANEFSPPASADAADVAARSRAQASASLALLAKVAAENERPHHRRSRKAAPTPVTPVIIVPPAQTVVPDTAPERETGGKDDPTLGEDEPVETVPDEKVQPPADDDDDLPADGDEPATDDPSSNDEPEAPVPGEKTQPGEKGSAGSTSGSSQTAL